MKKVLSFVLSVAMVICLMPAMAFADGEDAAPTTTATATGLSQFSDMDSITSENKEAVAVLVGLGIVDGMGDGTFQPKGNLTRAQASKLVSVLVKSGDKTEIPAPAADPFTDVAKSHWGAGAIKFGVDNGYINGMGDGTFHPEDKVTTAQLATMLVKLLGINSVDANYQWPENVMAWSSLLDLFFDVSQKGANDILDRENAAQMIYNALLAITQVKATTTGSDTQSVDGRSNYEPATNNKFDYTNDIDGFLQLIEKYFPKVTLADDENSDDAFARPVTVWKNGREKITDEIVRDPILVYTAQEVSSKNPTRANDQLKADFDGYTADARIFVNGSRQGTIVEDSDSDNIADQVSQLTGNGILVEVYSDDRDSVITRVVVADYDLATAKPKASDSTITLTVGDVEYGPYNKKSNFYSKISSAAKDDKVLVAIRNGEVVDAYLPTEEADAAITKNVNPTVVNVDGVNYTLQDSKVVAGGKEYTLGNDKATAAEPFNGLARNVDDKGTVFTDKYGYLVDYKNQNVAASNWANLESVYTISETNEYGESSTDLNAILVKEDGTTETVKLISIDPADDDYDATTANTVNTFKRTTRAAVNAGKEGARIDDRETSWYWVDGQLVTYKEAAAGYKLALVDPNNKSEGKEANVTTQELNDKSKNIDGYYLSDDLTVITVSGKKASSMKVKTSSKINKTLPGGTYKYVWKTVGNNKLVTAIYIVQDVDNTALYVTEYVGPTTYQDTKPGKEIKYYLDGNPTEQTGVIDDDVNVLENTWYTVGEIKEGMKINLLDDDKYVDADIQYGDTSTAYGSSMTINDGNQDTPDAFVLASDATIVDKDDLGITSVEDLVSEIAKVTGKEGNDPIHVSFTWTEDGDDNVVKLVIVKKVSNE